MRHFPRHCPDLWFGLDRGFVSSLLCFDEMYIGMLECRNVGCWMSNVDVLNIESWINQSSTSKERKCRTEQCNDQ